MTKKDYVLIAETIKLAQESLLYASVNPAETKRSVEHVAKSLAVKLEMNNALFKSAAFLTACGVNNYTTN